MAFTSVATDSFTGTAQAVLDSGSWTQVRDVGWGGTIRYTDPTGDAVGRFSEANTGDTTDQNKVSVYVRAAGTYAQSQYAEIVVNGLDTNWGPQCRLGVSLRMSTAQDDSMVGYYAYVCGDDAGSGCTIVIRKTDGTEDSTPLYSARHGSWADGDAFLFSATGGATTTLKVYRNRTELASVDDSSSPHTTANRPGLYIASHDNSNGTVTSVSARSWEGGDVTADATQAKRSMILFRHRRK